LFFVYVWWVGLSLMSVVNIGVYGVLVVLPGRMLTFYGACGGAFVFGCAFRSFFPRVDLERKVVFQCFPSAIFLGRTAATVAEISFAFLYERLLNEVAVKTGAGWWLLYLISWLPFLLSFAQLWCWAAVLTLRNKYHAVEEALWAIGGAIGVATFVVAVQANEDCGLSFGTRCFGLIATVVYTAFMVSDDVPMYWKREKEDRKLNRRTLEWWNGIGDALTRRVPIQRVDEWKDEFVWMGAYFSAAVWLAIFLSHRYA